MAGKRACAFCERLATEREHILPKWLRDLLITTPKGDHEWGHYETGERRQWTAVGTDFKAKIVCEPCNSGWMSDLETNAKPYLTPLIQGSGKTLRGTGKRLVATWGAKTAMALDAANVDQVFPKTTRVLVREAQQPPQGLLIWIGGSTAARGFWAQSNKPTVALPIGHVQGFGTTIRCGHLVFHMVGAPVDDFPATQITGKFASALIALWPGDRSVSWPPPRLLSTAVVERLGQELLNSHRTTS